MAGQIPEQLQLIKGYAVEPESHGAVRFGAAPDHFSGNGEGGGGSGGIKLEGHNPADRKWIIDTYGNAAVGDIE